MEYVILMVKPGFYNDNLISHIKDELDRYNLKVIKEFFKRFSIKDCQRCFYANFVDKEKYYEYISSKEMYIMLVSGDNCNKYAREIKAHIRNEQKLDHTHIENILHTTDDGLEFYHQYKICPELHDLDLCNTGYANLFIQKNDGLNIEAYTKKAIIIPDIKDAFVYSKDTIIGLLSNYKLKNGNNVLIINYSISSPSNNKQILKIVIFKYCLLKDKNHLKELYNIGVKGVLFNKCKTSINSYGRLDGYLEEVVPDWITIYGGKSLSSSRKTFEKFFSMLQ